MKLPYDGLPKPLYFHLDANIGNKKSCRKYVAVQGAASQVYLHSITSQRMNERLTNISIHSLTYAMHVDINPCCWCRLCGMMVVRMLRKTEKYEKTLELEEIFQKVASSAIHLIPPCIRFGLIRVIIESRRAMQLTWI